MRFLFLISTLFILWSGLAFGAAQSNNPVNNKVTKTEDQDARVLASYRAVLKGNFLKPYQGGNKKGKWYKVDPPTINRLNKSKESLLRRTKSIVNGIYVKIDKQNRIIDMIVCEVRTAKAGNKTGRVDFYALSSNLSMVAQYYKELADSLRKGDFRRSKLVRSIDSSLTDLPELRKNKAAIWFDTKKKSWILFSINQVDRRQLFRQIFSLSDYLEDAASRIIGFVYELYYLDFSDEAIGSVNRVDTIGINPPGEQQQEKSIGILRKKEADTRGKLVLNYLARNIKQAKKTKTRIAEKKKGKVLKRRETVIQPKGLIKHDVKSSGSLFALSHINKLDTELSGEYLDRELFLKKSKHRRLRHFFKAPDRYYGLDQADYYWTKKPTASWRYTDNFYYRVSSSKVYRGSRSETTNRNIPAQGMILGMGLGVEASLLGMSLLPGFLPAGQTAAITSLVGGSATVLTGGVVLAAVAIGATVQYFFHLQEIKTEKERIYYLLNSVERDLSKRLNE